MFASAGIVQFRVAALAPNVPARNQSDPRCPIMQLAPVGSASGLSFAGMDNAHCHQVSARCLYDCDWANTACDGINAPAATVTTATRIVRIVFMLLTCARCVYTHLPARPHPSLLREGPLS